MTIENPIVLGEALDSKTFILDIRVIWDNQALINLEMQVVNLNQIEMATEEDRQWEIDYWAVLFKATTWEEVKMLAEQNPVFEDAVKTMYEMSAEDEIREQCRAREDYYRTMNTLKAHIRNREQKIEEQDQQLAQKNQQIGQLESEIQRLKALLEKSRKK